MNISKALLAAIIAMSTVSVANAANQGQGNGKVTFKGTIIDAPCTVAPGEDGEDVTVKFGQLSKAQLEKDGKSKLMPFAIKLINCDFDSEGKFKDKNSVSVIFTPGSNGDEPNSLALTGGNAGGANIIINNGITGKTLDLGTSVPIKELLNGPNTLDFSAYVKKSQVQGSTITEGEFASVATFALTYQ